MTTTSFLRMAYRIAVLMKKEAEVERIEFSCEAYSNSCETQELQKDSENLYSTNTKLCLYLDSSRFFLSTVALTLFDFTSTVNGQLGFSRLGNLQMYPSLMNNRPFTQTIKKSIRYHRNPN